ncbi:MAG: ABC transporter substrate-binding protein [Chloroflexota bacterium]
MMKQVLSGRIMIQMLSIIIVLSGCSSNLNIFNGNDSSESGELTVYTTLPEDEVAIYIADFQTAYPYIEVTVVRESIAPMMDLLLSKQDKPQGRWSIASLMENLLPQQNEPQADVIWDIGLTSALYFEWNDLLKPYVPLGISRVDRLFIDEQEPPYWVGSSLSLTGFCVNPSEIARLGARIPTSWDDLLDPSYRRQIVMSNPATTETGLMAVLSILERMGEPDGWPYLDRLHRNIAYYTEGESTPCELADQGEIAIGIAKRFDRFTHVEMIYPVEKSGWELHVSAIIRKDTIKPVAKTFMDWTISEDLMRLRSRKTAITAYDIGFEKPVGYPANPRDQLITRNIPWSAANRERILHEWRDRYGDKLQQ